MEIKSTYTRSDGRVVDVVYRDGDPTENMEGKIVHGVHAYCFCGDKFVIVYSEEKDRWTPPGGAIEPGETADEAIVREVKEESNMKVVKKECVGYQDLFMDGKIYRQCRYYCEVEPYGDFVSDPDGDITEIKLIDPAEFQQYINWGVVGDRIMEKCLELRIKFN